MFNSKIRKAIGFTMWSTCYFKFCPYRWDEENYRFKRANQRHLILHWIVLAVEISASLFTFIRFAGMIGDSEPRPFIMASIFTIARTIEMLCFIQFHIHREEIMFFANEVFAYMTKNQERSSNEPERFTWDLTSVTLAISSFLVIVNPPLHALLLVNTPCIPHFLSSIILECKHHMDHSQPMSQKIPLILLEDVTVMAAIQIMTFNWTLIFIGSAWVKHILQEIRIILQSPDAFVKGLTQTKFRKSQIIVRHLNEAFRIYLTTSPTLFLAVLVLLIFSTLRFAEVDVTSYLMFPLCTARCTFESYSLLAWAGHVNTGSAEVLQAWKKLEHRSGPSQAYNRRFVKSCRRITISAGSMYTLESSIVLTTLHNCSESTFNLLVMYK